MEPNAFKIYVSSNSRFLFPFCAATCFIPTQNRLAVGGPSSVYLPFLQTSLFLPCFFGVYLYPSLDLFMHAPYSSFPSSRFFPGCCCCFVLLFFFFLFLFSFATQFSNLPFVCNNNKKYRRIYLSYDRHSIFKDQLRIWKRISRSNATKIYITH